MKKFMSKITSGVLLCTMITYTTPLFAFTKDETVYSKLDSTGNAYNTVISDHIKNTEKSSLINDISDLLNIKNIGGDETFEQNGNNLVWKANGNDIYYQGESKKDLPIQCDIKYELDGKEISSKDIAGKSGKVKITLSYKNTDSHIVKINGKDETLYTPFVAICGTVLSNDNNKNITISSGKVIDDGNKTIVVGLAFPGLQESLDISKNTIDIPNSVEISMEASDFEMNNIMTYVTSKVIEDDDLSIFDDLDKIFSEVNTLQSASKQLEDGSNTLRQGTMTYNEKSKEFNSALKQVSKGISSANSSYSEINNAIGLINSSTSTLQVGAKTISDGTEAISTNLLVLSEKLGELQAGTSALKTGKDNLISGVNQIISSINANTSSFTNQSDTIANLQKLITTNTNTKNALVSQNASLNNTLNAGSLTAEQEAPIRTQIATNTNLIALLDSNIDANNSTLALLKATDISSLQQLQAGLNSLQTGLQAFDSGIDAIYNGSSSLQTGANTLATKSSELSQGAKSLYQGTTQISSGAKALNAGSNQMKTGLNTLDYSTEKLTDANNQLTDGASTLANGAETLANGIAKFNKDGISKICNYANGDLKTISTRLEKLQELADNYNNFTMLDRGNSGEVKFILMVDSIKKDKDKKQEAIIQDKNNESEE